MCMRLYSRSVLFLRKIRIIINIFLRKILQRRSFKRPLQGSGRKFAYYTSAAVLAARSFHIPARYAEGYLLTSKQAEKSHGDWIGLSSSDGHAWAEVYMDGMGWVPVDVTSGFYYDTYALMTVAQSLRAGAQVAALDSGGRRSRKSEKAFSWVNWSWKIKSEQN